MSLCLGASKYGGPLVPRELCFYLGIPTFNSGSVSYFLSWDPNFVSLDINFVTRDPDLTKLGSRDKKITQVALMGHHIQD